MPLSPECHEKRLRERALYTETQIEDNLERAEMYQDYNRDHPGFFDMMINSGKSRLQIWLLQVVMLYTAVFTKSWPEGPVKI